VVNSVGPNQRVGISNEGFWGIAVRPNTQYKATVYAKGGSGKHGLALPPSSRGVLKPKADYGSRRGFSVSRSVTLPSAFLTDTSKWSFRTSTVTSVSGALMRMG
jgi:hypothetical protein